MKKVKYDFEGDHRAYEFGEIEQEKSSRTEQIRIGYAMFQLSPSEDERLYRSSRVTVIQPLPLDGSDESCFAIEDLSHSSFDRIEGLNLGHMGKFSPKRAVIGKSIDDICKTTRDSLEEDRSQAMERVRRYGSPFPRGL